MNNYEYSWCSITLKITMIIHLSLMHLICLAENMIIINQICNLYYFEESQALLPIAIIT